MSMKSNRCLMFENVDAHKGSSFVLHSSVLTYVSVFVISMWGGLVSFFERKEAFSWFQLFAHLMSASFAGFMTALLCEYANIQGPLVGLLAGVAAHMGTPALIRLMKKMKVIREFFGDDKDQK